MKNLKHVLITTIVGIVLFSCKKLEVDSKVFVEKALVGTWYVDMTIKKTLKNGTEIISGPDTITIAPRDTTIFTDNLKFINAKKDTLSFSVDQVGENISFSAAVDSTWRIDYFRKTSFKLIYTNKETVGNDVIWHITEKNFSK